MDITEVYGHLKGFDYFVITVYLTFSILIGVCFARKGTKDMSSYFIGGASMPWWLAGFSLLATCFAANTPLWMGDLIYSYGIEGIWLHWAFGIGGAFFALIIGPLWRRSAVMTDLEFLELRYSGKEASLLRFFNSLYGALFVNVFMMAICTLSIVTLMQAITGMPKWGCLLLTLGGTLIYSMVSGIWGVCSADFLQFFVSFTGSVVLALFAISAAGGFESLVDRVSSLNEWPGHNLNVLPRLGRSAGLPMMTVIFLFTFHWITMMSSGGYVAQRLFSVRNVKGAAFACILFIGIFYSIIPLPWIITIVSSKVVMPSLGIGQEAYPRMAMAILPTGLKGILIASLLAAFMSTYSSLLSWGSSYIVNDIYKRFFVKKAPTKHYVRIGQISMLPMAIIAAVIALYSSSILNLFFYAMLLTSGYGTVTLARWMWWRINAWSEIACLGGTCLSILSIFIFVPDWIKPEYAEQYFGHRMLLVTVVSIISWFLITLLTKPSSEQTVNKFYNRVHPPGFWQPVRKRLGLKSEYSVKTLFYRWFIMLIAVFCPLAGLIKCVFGSPTWGLSLVAVGSVGFILAIREAKKFPLN